jgi:hypothetical protein
VTFAIGIAITFAIGTAIGMADSGHSAFAQGGAKTSGGRH